ncbi:hypothetical protein FA15DRAFT_562946, partial [Coprinopsis marcescibilis]
GKMVQIGMNMGPCHARVLGWAKSFTQNLSTEEKVSQDTDLIGAMSILWCLAKAQLPIDIIHQITTFLDEQSYPMMGTQNLPAEAGFSVSFEGKEYHFSQAGRAPPEG